MPDITCRVLQDADIKELRELRIEALQNAEHLLGEYYEDELKHPYAWYKGLLTHNTVVGAFVDDQLVGMSIMSPYSRGSRKQTHKAITWFTYVRSSLRGMGIARTIRLATFAIARERGITTLSCGIISTNTPIIALNKSIGCQEMYTEKNAICHNGVFYNLTYMIKFLDESDEELSHT